MRDYLAAGVAPHKLILGMPIYGRGFTNTAGEQLTLAAWRTTTGKDANSVSADPLFVSSSNLHIASPTSPVSNVGTYLPIFQLDDFDGQVRSAPTIQQA